MTLSFWGRAFLSLVILWRLKIYLLGKLKIYSIPQISENCFLHSSFTLPLFIGLTEWTNEGRLSKTRQSDIQIQDHHIFIYCWYVKVYAKEWRVLFTLNFNDFLLLLTRFSPRLSLPHFSMSHKQTFSKQLLKSKDCSFASKCTYRGRKSTKLVTP